MTLIEPTEPVLLVAGSNDFVRRILATVRQNETLATLRVFSGQLEESRALLASERPDIFLVDIGLGTSNTDIEWLRGLLSDIRDRRNLGVHIILALMAPERFALGGDLFFAEKDSLKPSGLINSLLVAKPAGAADALSIEDQAVDCLQHILELRAEGHAPLPALWDENWAPVVVDPVSRDTWMRWLPRYATYVNENPLIVGPTGSGKTRLAQALHALSGRKGPFVSITPRDFSSPELVQAELFGSVAGAYTGAVEKWGLVKRADKGTLFIDELQSIDLDLQGKLITFIENKSYRRVGEAGSHQADVRFVFATNRPLVELVANGKIRDDFAYRLERLQLLLPPLKERRLDIGGALAFSLAKVLRERDAKGSAFNSNEELGGITADAYAELFRAAWPGNLRQLENSVAQLVEIARIRKLGQIDKSCVVDGLKNSLGAALVAGENLTAVNPGPTSSSTSTKENSIRPLSIADLDDETRMIFEEEIASFLVERMGEYIEDAFALAESWVKGKSKRE